MLTLRIYNLRTEKQEEKFADLYDYLYKDEYQQLAIQNDLIEYQNSIQSKNELDRLLVFYEGMTMRVDWNGILIYGDIFDNNTYDYIIDELTIKCFGF